MERLTTLLFCSGIMLLAYVIILGLIFCDLRAGIRKAKQQGKYRTSAGYKRTIEKISKYYNMTFALSLLDALQLAIIFFLYHFYRIDIVMIPWFTLIALGYVGFVEVKSIWEPADIKERKLQQDYKLALIALIREYGTVENLFRALNVTKEDTINPDLIDPNTKDYGRTDY
ncbi:MAG: hypothetical protein II886_13110 [Prevotella sp.]|nr:hypothetical protein [Prevotella sp.]